MAHDLLMASCGLVTCATKNSQIGKECASHAITRSLMALHNDKSVGTSNKYVSKLMISLARKTSRPAAMYQLI